MTRNLYLGADLTPALQASTVDQAVDAAARSSTRSTRPSSRRSAPRSLANEIKKRKPDIVGLQEAAWWRTGPVQPHAGLIDTPAADQTDPQGGDFLADLLKAEQRQEARSASKKRAAALQDRGRQDEFDVELPVNNDGQRHGLAGADHNERLTMRDAILVRKGVKVKFKNADQRHVQHPAAASLAAAS